MQIADMTDLGRILREARTRQGWSQQQAADAAGVSRRLVNLLEGGRHPNAEVWRVLSLLNALDVSLHAELDSGAPADSRANAIANEDDIDLDAHLATFRTKVRRV